MDTLLIDLPSVTLNRPTPRTITARQASTASYPHLYQRLLYYSHLNQPRPIADHVQFIQTEQIKADAHKLSEPYL